MSADESHRQAAHEISRAKHDYCRMLDERNWAGLAALMTDDMEFGFSDENSTPSMTTGRSETLRLLRSMVAGSTTTHRVTHPQLSFDGTKAEVDWSMTCTTVFDDGAAITGHGRYLERWHTDGTAWKLASMTLSDFCTDPEVPDELR